MTTFGAYLNGVGAPWAELLEQFTTAEAAGFETAWTMDNVVGPVHNHPEIPTYEAFTLLAAERVAMLVEELTILESMWTHDRTTFAGEHYSVTEAICSPKGSRGRRPEVLVELKNARLLAPVAGSFADRANLLGNDDDAVRRLADATRSEAQKAGRIGDDIVMGRLFQVLFTDTNIDPDDVKHVLTRRAAEIGVEAEELIAYHAHVASYVGPPEGAAKAILERTRDLGMDEVVLDIDTVGILDHDRTIEGLGILAEHVLPELK